MKQILTDGDLITLKLNLDKEAETVFGIYEGYHVYISEQQAGRYGSQYSISCSVSRDGLGPDKELLKELRQYGEKVIQGASAQRFKVTAMVKGGMTTKTIRSNIKAALKDLVSFFQMHGFVSTCEESGKTTDLNLYLVGGSIHLLSSESYAKLSLDTDAAMQTAAQTSENIVLGTVGAVLGSLIGVAAIILISQLGYVAAISGIIMAVCTVKGYEILAKKFSGKGAIICGLIVIGMTYFANELDWAILVSRFAKVDLFTAFGSLGDLKTQGYIEMSDYWANLAMLMLFTLITAGITIFSSFKTNRNRYVIRPLG